MSMALLGQHFDIHTGGVDHRELHHVNEIAQSQAFLGDGRPWVRYWLHNEFLQLGAEKMAKSAGGAPRLADLTEAGYHPMAYRLFLLGGHYRSQLDFTTAAIDAAQATLRRLVARVQPLRPLPPVETLAGARQRTEGDPAAQRLLDTIDAAVAADLSTPKILAALQDALREPALTPDGPARRGRRRRRPARPGPGQPRPRRPGAPPRAHRPVRARRSRPSRSSSRTGPRPARSATGPAPTRSAPSSTSSASISPTPPRAPSGSSASGRAGSRSRAGSARRRTSGWRPGCRWRSTARRWWRACRRRPGRGRGCSSRPSHPA